MKSLRGAWILLAVLCLNGCRSTKGVGIAGRVVDPDGKPVAGVEVRVEERLAARTDRDGRFQLPRITAAERNAVSFSAPRFMDTTRIYGARTKARGAGNTVIIWPRVPAASLDAGRGGRVSFPGGSVTFPPNALVDPTGKRITGNVSVSFTALDATNPGQIRSAPGDFTARMRDGSIQQLETFGVFEVFVEDQQRRRAELASGQNAFVQLAVRARREIPREVGLYSFEPVEGRWIEAGTLQTTQPQELSAPIRRLTTVWNADQVLQTTCIKLLVLDCSSTGVPLALVEHNGGVGYTGYSSDIADTAGFACLPVKRSAVANVVAHHPNLPNVKTEMEIMTPIHVAKATLFNCNNPNRCPHVLTSHLGHDGFVDNLNTQDLSRWDVSSGAGNTSDLNFDVCWRTDHVETINNILRIRLDQDGFPNQCPTTQMSYASGEYRTDCFYGYGTYKAKIKHARGEGLLTTFFTYSEPQHGVPWDEIDVEIFGRDPNSSDDCNDPNDDPNPNTIMWTNYFANGVVPGSGEKICLDLDLTQAHTYQFQWSPTEIKWYVDSVLRRTESRGGNPQWPVQPGRIMVSLWAVKPGGPWTDLGTFTYNGTGHYAEYHGIEYNP